MVTSKSEFPETNMVHLGDVILTRFFRASWVLD
jgi:hypothetical protein